ncbi:MAG: SufE family protein [Verrucomicrobiota bacterium]
MSPADREAQFIEELNFLPDSFERMTHLVESDKRRPGLPEEQKLDERLVPGCQSRVWIVASPRENEWHFESDSDAPIVRALAGTLCEIFSGSDAETISAFAPTLLDQTQLRGQLTPTRQNGFNQIVQTIKTLAK